MTDHQPVKVTRYWSLQDPQVLFDALHVARRNAGINLHDMSRTIKSSVAWVRSNQGENSDMPSSVGVLMREAEACNCELRFRVYSLRKLRLRQQQQQPGPGQAVFVDEYNEVPVRLGKQIQQARERAELTLDQWGELVGMQGHGMNRWESPNGKVSPSVESLMRALEALECGLAFVLIDNATGEPVTLKADANDSAEDTPEPIDALNQV